LLPLSRRIAPDQLRVTDGKAFEARFVDIRYGRALGLGDRFLAQEIRSFVSRNAEIVRKQA
jgi:hypothetical protein